jgi:hypothetical protein
VYAPPAPESRASLRIAPPIDVIGYLENGDECSGARRFNDSDNPFKRPDRTLFVPSGRRIALNLVATGPGPSACNVLLSFAPQPGARYEAQMTLSRDRCFAQIVEPGKDPLATAAAIGLRQVRPASCTAL